MARRRVDANEESKPSVAERTIPMFPEPGQATNAPPPPTGAPLGTLTPEQREQEIKTVQDDAVSRAIARHDLEKRAESDETNAITRAELDAELAAEREAIVNEPPLDAGSNALGAGFFGNVPSGGSDVVKQALQEKRAVDGLPEHASTRFGSTDEGDEVTYTKGEEMYGKPGQFSTYRVGPFTTTTRVRAGETRIGALNRLRAEMDAFFAEERERAKKAFLSHYPNAFS